MDCDDERFHISPESIVSQKWKDHHFIMPAISVGQVGQLAVDLLLSNLGDEVTKIGDIYSDAILPIIGRQDRQTDKGLCTGLELYESKTHKLIILHQRAPFVKGRIPSFRRRLISWIKNSLFSKVFLFTGVSSHIRKDADLSGSLFRFLTTDGELKTKFSTDYNWKEYTTKKSEDTNDFLIPGSGILKSLHEDCIKEEISFSSFIVFCNPGNTIREATQLVEHMLKFMNITDYDSRRGLKMPGSWDFPGDELNSNYIY